MKYVSIDWVKVSPSRIRGRLYDAYWGVSPLKDNPRFTPWFNVEASETELGPWIPLLPSSVQGDYAIGLGHILFRASAPPMVRLSISPSETAGAVQWSRPYLPGSLFKSTDFLLYREVLRKEILTLQEYSGYPCYLVKRIRGGFPCPECDDEILGAGTASPVDASGSCGLCFGTGIYGGYHRPQPILADWPSRPQGSGTQGKGATGRTEDEKFSPIHVYAFPSVASDDILVDAGTGNRFVISEVHPVLWKIHTAGQDLSAYLLPKGHPAYRIPVAGEAVTG